MKTLEALATIERDAAEKAIAKGTVFKAKDQDEEDQLFRLGAVREYSGSGKLGMLTSIADNPTVDPTGEDVDAQLAALEQQAEAAETALRARYEELYGGPPHANMKFDTIRARVKDKDAGFEAVAQSEEAEQKAAELTAANEQGKSGSDAAEAPRGRAARGRTESDVI